MKQQWWIPERWRSISRKIKWVVRMFRIPRFRSLLIGKLRECRFFFPTKYNRIVTRRGMCVSFRYLTILRSVSVVEWITNTIGLKIRMKRGSNPWYEDIKDRNEKSRLLPWATSTAVTSGFCPGEGYCATLKSEKRSYLYQNKALPRLQQIS